MAIFVSSKVDKMQLNIHDQIKLETQKLKKLAAEGGLCEKPQWKVGLELEGWILDDQMNPMALSENLVEHAPQGEFCTELINCIAEINLKPVDVCSSFLLYSKKD